MGESAVQYQIHDAVPRFSSARSSPALPGGRKSARRRRADDPTRLVARAIGVDVTCPLCGRPVHVRTAQHVGYAEHLRFDLLECAGCEVSFANPTQFDARLYEWIYSQPQRVPGYVRYAAYARAVERASDPLATLCGLEDMYFAVARTIERELAPDGAILEIGSGLGYTTYALATAGYRSEGWDTSAQALEAASARFGSLYKQRDIARATDADRAAFDAVVLTEVIEHVEDPIGFVRKASALLRPNGILVMTTPNKSFFPPGTLWATDLPPIHLWWFSEASIRALAQQTNCALSFFDFTEYNDRARSLGRTRADAPLVPTLARDGTVLTPAGPPEPERFHLFPLSQSILPPAARTLRRVRRRLGMLDEETKHRYARRETMAFTLRPNHG